ncbi:uncharacterized protein LOC108595748 isoform X2 [Drosophila busckii]|uniref:uncharacterized protein LOC108595748 isoform X2 n=1 Tax=Drosophila busckii TaxID=30019 RepID=UPI00083F4B3A|nr:uncharacterized protein LOC108595748 isoform X2 [Drosophila busckii]
MQLLQALCLMLICLVCGTAGLVHYKKVEKTDKGCKFNDAEFAVGEVTQDPNSCGVLACMNTNGDTLIHYNHCHAAAKYP